MENDLLARSRAYYKSYVDKDRAAIEALLAPDFHFTSPLDNRLDRATYFERCWPNSAVISEFKFENLVADGDRVFVTYDGRGEGARGFRNTEIHTFRDGKIVDVQCYFGWPVPHPADLGGFIAPAEMSATTSRE
jgi:ketosteroid isomerase-like protein